MEHAGPALLEHAGAGVSLELGGHQGAGDFSLFIQPGGFHQPQQLWNSRLDGAQPMWVEPNTHTHANWVFTDPGVHLVGVRAVVKDNAGEVHTDEQVVRIAVGDGTDPAEAFDATFAGPGAPSSATVPTLTVAIAVAAGGIVLALIAFAAVRAARAKKGGVS
ncbi:choice-of-anchor M domain-containing protein [Corynebacterium lipophiloflavum]|uniref:Actinobacterial surface-anchored domain protein n=1 Tax=Corynebacterium lipophiloflavum (strain ATCC 700352 / DSM 44291 / CCUG 37336 / JCM 10383 / DMMZ 1944) TaxID=525263 RepID=C0XUJ3_CORLD|nr:choice-of-anchor M domain-containing protein [Corynebacterium lipophiloflavum]EEI16018.1 actinobacterial surface-anchored domain protein [Corynebacterium lipophiloflavum DSM 44291]